MYAKPPFGGPQQVLKYLARYTHRVAISNSRIVEVSADRVTFSYKDYADEHRSKVMTLSGVEFLRRFVQHVLPKGFVKVRHYGLLANRNRDQRLTLCRRLLALEILRARILSGIPSRPSPPGSEDRVIGTLTPVVGEPVCPHCGSRNLIRFELPRTPAARFDSS